MSSPRSSPSSRGQIAMWMLTKMSMLFFILMLAFLMTQLSGTFRNALCNDQARLSAQRLASGVSDVVNSPLEDERKVLPLESALSTGGGDLARYTVNVTNSPDSQTQVGARTVLTGELRVTVDTQKDCHGAGRAPYQNFQVHLRPPGEVVAADVIEQGLLPDLAQTLTLTPSDIDHRAQYLVVVKCTRKQFPPVKQLYVESCYQDDPDHCTGFAVLGDDNTPACNPFELTNP